MSKFKDSALKIAELFINSDDEAVLISNEGVQVYSPNDFSERKYVISGAFNPLHAGHLHIYNYLRLHAKIISSGSIVQDAKEKEDGLKLLTKSCVMFELCINHYDKDDIDDINELAVRIRQFEVLNLNLVVTKYPTFAQKSRIFKNCKFVMGCDAYNRVIESYENADEKVTCSLSLMDNACSFVYVPREGYSVLHDDVFSLQVESLYDIIRIELRLDPPLFCGRGISSTEIRNEKRK